MKTESGYRTRQYGKSHAYYGPDGTKLPGASTVAKVANDGGAFVVTAANNVADWAGDHKDTFADMSPTQVAKAGKEYWQAHRWDAAARGTTIHDHAAELLAGKDVDVPDEDVGIVDTFLRMAKEWQLRPMYVEAFVLSKRWQYMGRLDCLGWVDGGRPALLDWKTGRSGIYPETALQLAGYRYAELIVDEEGNELPMPDVDLVAAVWLQDDRYEVVPLDAGRETWRTFLYAAEVWRYMQRDRTELVLDPITPTMETVL
jgi:hypothetical protein